MTRLAPNLSSYVNGVAERHQETALRMFPGYPIRAITNGVHPETWVHRAFARLFDRLGAHWPHEPELLGATYLGLRAKLPWHFFRDTILRWHASLFQAPTSG